MRRFVTGLALAGALAQAGPAAAWGGQGHQLVGSIADQLLGANAKAHVAAILHVSLHDAGPWADCARSVQMLHGKLQWSDRPKPPAVCAPFLTPSAKREMTIYAAANWDQCVDNDPNRACHAKYHFADIPEADGAYDPNRPGATDHDVVHTINAAIARLEGKTPPKPFTALTERQALFLLAHMVGDLHQPLHVGAVYLSRASGARLDPANPPDKTSLTQGGNAIMYTHSGVLHATWDDLLASLGTDGAPYAAAARALPATPGDFHGWAASWANDTVAQAHSPAFQALVFGPYQTIQVGKKTKQAWTIDQRPADYGTATLRDEQKAQLIKGGRHLADLLNAIWP